MKKHHMQVHREWELIENVETIGPESSFHQWGEWKLEKTLTFPRLQKSWESPTVFHKSQHRASLPSSAFNAHNGSLKLAMVTPEKLANITNQGA